MSTIKSSAEDLTLNADGSGNDIKFQINAVEKASISSAGLLTSTTIDATALTGNLPAIDGSNLTVLDATALTGTVPTAKLGSGTADADSFLRGDGAWEAVAGIPSGVIAMWYGAISTIPAGWVICDGTNSTPDLTDRFVIHADADSGGTNDVGDTGGSHTSGAHTLSISEMPSHTHTMTYSAWLEDVKPLGYSGGKSWNGTATAGTSAAAILSTGGGGSHTHTATPKYYALAYIMKT